MTTLSLVLAALMVAFEFQNLLAWWGGRTLSIDSAAPCEDYTLVVPLYGDPRYFTARESLLALRAHVLVVCEVTPPKLSAYADDLKREGFDVLRVRMPDAGAARLVRLGLLAVPTTYALRLDADTILSEGIERAVGAFAASGADIGSTRVEASAPRSIAAHLQALEYRMAMLSRRFRPWLTSGACFIGRTDSLRLVFTRHSMWTPGEDIETGRVAHALKMKVRHVDYVVRTDVPESFRALFRQRRLWWAGNFRHNIINADRNAVQLPIWTLYNLLCVWAMVYFRVWHNLSLTAVVHGLPLVFVAYTGITIISNLQVLSPWMLVLPLYSFVQTFVMPLAGAAMYVKLARRRGRLGRYRFGLRRCTIVPGGAGS